jgi:hypothetical protein
MFPQQRFPAARLQSEDDATSRLFIETADVSRAARVERCHTSATDEPEGVGGGEDGLEDAARVEHEYLRERLRDELKREPTEEELNEWLRRHTEGY